LILGALPERFRIYRPTCRNMVDAVATAGRVVLAATPLGRPDDASPRLRDALASADVIAAEDTRRLRRLCSDLAVAPTGRVVSFYDANEKTRVPELLEAARSGADILVITDAGMPSVSDPGYRLVTAAIEASIPVTCLPGPSAVLTALAVSGLPVDRFCFEGFLPRKAGERRRALAELSNERRTLVLFEAPHRLGATLTDAAVAFGTDRPAAVCRELTKVHEQVLRGSLGELADWARGGVLGEITLVIGGASSAQSEVTVEELAADVRAWEADGQSRKDAIAEVARARRVAKRQVFDAVVAAKHAADQEMNVVE
jgi:16S rRNA (cytidine1402-2'-O)-methyltransferase